MVIDPPCTRLLAAPALTIALNRGEPKIRISRAGSSQRNSHQMNATPASTPIRIGISAARFTPFCNPEMP